MIGRIGGAVQTMVWDPKGERLAVSFQGEKLGFSFSAGSKQ